MPMEKQSSKITECSRRSALKTIGAAGITSGGIVPVSSASSANAENYYLGKSVFTEVKVEYSDIRSNLFSTGFGLLGYIVDHRRGRVIINDGPTDVGGNDLILTNSESYVGERESLRSQVVKRGLTAETDYRRHRRRIVPIDGSVTAPEVSVARNGEAVNVQVPNREFSVGARDERTVQLEAEEYAVRTKSQNPTDMNRLEPVESRTQEVRPELSIRNHGIVSIFGADGQRLLPLGTGGGYSRSRRLAHRNLAPDSVTNQSSDDLLAVDALANSEKSAKQDESTNNGGSI